MVTMSMKNQHGNEHRGMISVTVRLRRDIATSIAIIRMGGSQRGVPKGGSPD